MTYFAFFSVLGKYIAKNKAESWINEITRKTFDGPYFPYKYPTAEPEKTVTKAIPDDSKAIPLLTKFSGTIFGINEYLAGSWKENNAPWSIDIKNKNCQEIKFNSINKFCSDSNFTLLNNDGGECSYCNRPIYRVYVDNDYIDNDYYDCSGCA